MKRWKDGDLVLVEWRDPHGPTVPWTAVEKIKAGSDAVRLVSVGFIYRTREGVTVIPHLDGDRNEHALGFGEINLPRGVIHAVHPLKMPRLTK